MNDEDKTGVNAYHVERELQWLSDCLSARIQKEFKKDTAEDGVDVYAIISNPPKLGKKTSPFSKFIKDNELNEAERLMMMMSLAPYFKPQLLDVFLILNSDLNKNFTEFGGISGKQHKGFIPTGQTLLFLLTGNDLSKRFHYMYLLASESKLIRDGEIILESSSEYEPYTSGALIPSRDLVELFSKGGHFKPAFGADFPAKLITTGLEWDELILPSATKSQLEEIDRWLKYRESLKADWDLDRKLKPGFRALFYGPPGTGKTLTASLIGKNNDLDVYRIDLSKIVSKYIGETEKNLAKVFERAENKDWILFFDEADALFGKRTKVESSNDRHANQETAYLLQRIEDYDGLVILATNLKNNIDDAFMRRFQSVIYFPIPKKAERLAIWQNTLPKNGKLHPDLDIHEVADKYQVTGGTILNVVQYGALKAIGDGGNQIREKDIVEGIKKELMKVGRTV